MKQLPTGQELRDESRRLGISPVALEGQLSAGATILEPALQDRYLAFLRDRRDSRLWWIAFISAVASVLSAAASWTGALYHLH
jgi:hypothetical protein